MLLRDALCKRITACRPRTSSAHRLLTFLSDRGQPYRNCPKRTAKDRALSSTTTGSFRIPPRNSRMSAGSVNGPNGPTEFPAGVADEAKLLEAFYEVASLTKVTAKSAGSDGSLWISVDFGTSFAGTSHLATIQIPVVMGSLRHPDVQQASYSQRNMPGNSQRKYTVQGHLPVGSTTATTSAPIEAADALLTSHHAQSGKQHVMKAGADNISVVHQVWSGNRLQSELHVPKSLHGGSLTGTYFAADAAWHPAGDAVAYIAELPSDEKTPAWGGPEAIKDTAAPKSWRGQGVANEDWGELFTGKRAPGLFVLDTVKKAVVKIAPEGLPTDVSLGSPVWCPDGQGLVVVAWSHTASNFTEVARKLGVVFCYNRPTQLWHIPVTRDADGGLVAGKATHLTSAGSSALSPVFSPAGSSLLYLSHDTAVATGTHSATAQLCCLPWPQASQGSDVVTPRVVVDVVQRPDAAVSQGFPGLYAGGLPDLAFVGPSTMLINTQWGSCQAIVAVDITTGAVAPVTPVSPATCSYTYACTVSNRVLAIRVSPTQPPHLVIADLPQDVEGLSKLSSPLAWQPVSGFESDLPAAVEEKLADLEVTVMNVTPSVGDTSMVFESIVYAPKSRKGPLPAIITPHGGPHTGMTLGWFPAYSYLAALGYAIISPNYRGSTGYGQAALASLPGNIGRHDVDDCMASLQAAVDAGVADVSKVSVVGGSHGGFLTGHLLGQFPDAFKSGAMRNPVCNLSLMVGLSDIMDWCYVEVFGIEQGRQRFKLVATPEDLQAMYNKSPVAHVHKVKAPVILMLGAKDRRVPPPDGLQFQYALKAAGVPVRTVVFPEDTHALDKPQTEMEQWMNVTWMMKTYCK